MFRNCDMRATEIARAVVMEPKCGGFAPTRGSSELASLAMLFTPKA
jgi:hypothetical protein